MFFMLTGCLHIQVPEKAHPLIVARAVQDQRRISLKGISPATPDAVVGAIEKSLQRESRSRFASAAEFGRLLKMISDHHLAASESPKVTIISAPEVVHQAAQKVIGIAKRPPILSKTNFNAKSVKAGSVWIWPKDGSEMVFVPAGPFSMGSNTGLRGEMPEHEAVTQAYLIDKYPVTNARYKQFLDEVKDYPVPRGGAAWSQLFDWDPLTRNYPLGQADSPVFMISFDDARAFAAWAGKRLPTEAEWEKAARWNPRNGACTTYPWGNEWDTHRANSAERVAGRSFAPINGGVDPAYVWFQLFRKLDSLDPHEANSYELLTKVYAYPQGASALGVMDMSGNMHEWCETEHQGRCYDGHQDPAISPDDVPSMRSCRGGAWADHPFYLRSCARYALRGSTRYDRVTIRCVVSV